MKNRDGYDFELPNTLRGARIRLREVTIDIMNVEKQLGDLRREKQMGSDYDNWREKTKAAKIFMVAEQQAIKDWILDRHRQLSSKKVGIWPYNDPRSIIQRAIIEGRKALAGEKNELPEVLDLADLFLNHDA